LRYRDRVVAASRGIAMIGGFVDRDGDIHNAAFFAYDGELQGVYHKIYLPNYGVFDEERYFQRGRRSPIFVLGGVRIGVSIRKEATTPFHLDLDVSEVVVTERASPRAASARSNPIQAPLDGPAEVYSALVCGTRDYVNKSGAFQKVLLGLSGGVDSSLTAAVAVDALGRENVVGVLMPSRFNSTESL